MPQILNLFGFIFFFYSNEHEPIHVHVKGKGGDAKFDVVPEVKLVSSKNLKKKEIRTARKLVEKNRQLIIEEWHKYFK